MTASGVNCVDLRTVKSADSAVQADKRQANKSQIAEMYKKFFTTKSHGYTILFVRTGRSVVCHQFANIIDKQLPNGQHH